MQCTSDPLSFLSLSLSRPARCLASVLAGYTESMRDLFHFNAGLASRFPHMFSFPDYGVDELTQIARSMIHLSHFQLSNDAEAREALTRLVAPIVTEVPCGNARSVENRIAAAISAQSTRLREEGCSRPCGEQEADAAGGTDAPDAADDANDADNADARLFQLTAADLDAARGACDRASAVLGGGGGNNVNCGKNEAEPG